jgi:hypothetical protein
MNSKGTKLASLRQVITENLRVQKGGEPIDYVNVGTALQDACSKQNHAIFARRGCGKTLLLHHSTRVLRNDARAIYLNCEDFKRHSFPNVLIEILNAIFQEMDGNLQGWFGKKRRSKDIIRGIIAKLAELKKSADVHDENIRKRIAREGKFTSGARADIGNKHARVGLNHTDEGSENEEIERSFSIHREKLEELDGWLPSLKRSIADFFSLSSTIKYVILQIDDLYHLKRTDQAFVVDYIHRLCKDLPIYFKIATLRHASTLYLDRDGQPIGAQERHDYQPINIDYTFSDFKKTTDQNRLILEQFGVKAGLKKPDLHDLFKGEGFNRLVMAGGGVPRDVLSLFLEVLNDVDALQGGKIGKDEVRILSRANFERKIEELKQDSKGDEQDELIRGIYLIRQFCLDRKTNVFVVQEKTLQQDDGWRALIYRLLDYRIIHSCASALTHKSFPGTYHAFAIDIGCYAHLRKLQDRFTEIDVSSADAKDKMRSAPMLQPIVNDDVAPVITGGGSTFEEALLQQEMDA